MFFLWVGFACVVCVLVLLVCLSVCARVFVCVWRVFCSVVDACVLVVVVLCMGGYALVCVVCFFVCVCRRVLGLSLCWFE